MELLVREITTADIEPLLGYWFDAKPEFLTGMGVDLAKMPAKEEFRKALADQIAAPYEKKKAYCMIWLVDGQAIGHCNINNITFGDNAYMHLHMWEAGKRQQGIGSQLVKLTLPHFFKNFNLKKLYCEPNAQNPAPNNTLKKVGFTFVKNYMTVPSFICSEQLVSRWELGAP